MSDTPRTDYAAEDVHNAALDYDMRYYRDVQAPQYVVGVELSRTLERELAAMTAENAALRKAGDDMADYCYGYEQVRIWRKLRKGTP